MNYTFKHLRYFVAAGETGSVTKAAEQVHVSQPSISAAITHLEAVFGLQLFIRHHAQGLSLTPSGRRILGESKRLLNQAEGLHQYASELGESLSGQLDVGCFTTLAPILMPSLIKDFCTRYPEVRVRCHEIHQEDLLDGLLRGRFEVALAYDLHLTADFDFDPIASFPPYAIVPPDHPLANRKRVSIKALIEEPMILLDLPHSRDYFQSIFLSLGLEPKIEHRSASPHMVRGLVANGFGYSLLNARLSNDQALDGRRFTAIPLSDKIRPLSLGIVRPAQSRLTRATTAFAEHCHETWAQRRFPCQAAPVPGPDKVAPRKAPSARRRAKS
jgi:DNA-binding transcriptional LysR family regulator